MDFTSLYTSSSTLSSPNCELILTATPALLVLRDATSFQVLQSWRRTATTTTPQLGFSDDSRYCAVADVDAGTVNVYSVASEHVAAVIHAGSEALQGARWIPSSSGTRWIACWSKHGIRVTLWNLESGKQHIINSPKRGPIAGWATCPRESAYFALLERHRGKDYLGIYETNAFQLVRHFAVPTHDAHDLSWSPCGRYIAVWDSALDYGVHVMTPDGRLLASHTSDDNISGLGVRTTSWHPSGRFLAIGGYDERVRILNDISWTVISEVAWPSSVWTHAPGKRDRFLVYREPISWLTSGQPIVSFESQSATTASLASSSAQSRRAGTANGSRPAAKEMGIHQLSFCPNGEYLCIGAASRPELLLIVNFVRCSEALPFTAVRPRIAVAIACDQHVLKSAWRPQKHDTDATGDHRAAMGRAEDGEMNSRSSLAIVTGQKSVILWTSAPADIAEENSEDADRQLDQSSEQPPSLRRQHEFMDAIGIPSKADFQSTDLTWANNGESIILASKDKFCLAYPLPLPDDK